MSLADELAAEIRTVIADLGLARSQLDLALHHFERAGQSFAQVGRGTTSHQLLRAVAACGESAELLVTTMGVIDQARELLWNYLLAITPSLAGPRPTAAPAAVSPASLHEQPDAAAGRPAERTPPAPFIGSFFDRLPARQRDDSPTDGVLTTEDGAEVQAVTSGRAGPGQGAPGLKPPWSQTISVTRPRRGSRCRADPSTRAQQGHALPQQPAVSQPRWL